MLKNLNPTWDLESVFPGGSSSTAYRDYLDAIEADLKALAAQVSTIVAPDNATVTDLLAKVQKLGSRLIQAEAFVGCLLAENVHDQQARVLAGRCQQLLGAYASVLTHLDKHLLSLGDQGWDQLLSLDEVKPLTFNLNERRRNASEKMPTAQETLVNSLSVDGYHGWPDLYSLVVSRITIPAQDNGEEIRLSAGQAANRLSDGNREFRDQLFASWEESWGREAEYCALSLNHLAGYRINLYRHRGWDDVLKEPLNMNRMTAGTLDAMWGTINQNKGRVVAYLRRKQQLLGLDRMGWHDIGAPIGHSESKVSYDDAANFIIEQFGRFSPKMADWAAMAISKRWVEAEDRPGKRPGAFCTDLPELGETRIFTTFSGTMGNVATFAHELGHGYHGWVMRDMPMMNQQIAMNVAETASTFAEMIVADAAAKNAKSTDERISLIDDKLQRAVAMLMNIHARFLFETRFYEERKRGLVSVKRLNELMVEAQKEAYRDALDLYHPHFWASKGHFYGTGVPFYNFPYTFGYLFSAGVYSSALQVGPSFEDKYIELLRDTGRMTVEELAQRHLGADLTKSAFWQSAIDVGLADLDEFMELTRK